MYGVKGKDSMPSGRTPFGAGTSVVRNNPTVHSKGANNGARIQQPAEVYKSQIPASMLARDVTGFGTPKYEQVGFPGDAKAFVAPTFAMGNKSAGINKASTAGAKGMRDKT